MSEFGIINLSNPNPPSCNHFLRKSVYYSAKIIELVQKMALSENKQKMLRSELYYAFTPELVAARARCKHACARYNNAGEVSRRRLTELWRE